MDLLRPWREYPSSRSMVERTPRERDRVVDLVRALSLVVVVFGHSFMASVTFGPTVLSNTLAQTPWLQLATWILQVMPLFFAAGAWANALSYRKAAGYPSWLNDRVRRLVRPVIIYTLFWIVISPLLLWWDSEISLPLLKISTQLLWFLGAYLLVTALTPMLVRLAVRPVVATLGWLALGASVDVARLAGAPSALGLANFVVVWALAGQCGLWAFSPAQRPTRAQALGIAVGAVAVNVCLVALGPWPRSLVGLPGEEISNMAPPSVVLALHCVTLAALVVLGYDLLARVAKRDEVWRPTCVVNAAAMTVYLWHLAGMILAISAIALLGRDLVGFSTPGWALPRFTFWLLFAAFTVGLVFLMRPFEHIPLPWWDAKPSAKAIDSWSYRARSTVSSIGVVLVAVGLLALSVTGLVGFPFGVASQYAGFAFTPGLTIIVAFVGVVLIRLGAVGPEPRASTRDEAPAPAAMP